MPDPNVIETVGLKKSYAGVQALRGLDLTVPAGSICGLLGRNGAGKTTALKILLGMTHADDGRANIFGLDPGAAADGVAFRRRIGFVSEDKDLYDSLTVGQMIRFTARFFPTWRTEAEEAYLRAFELPLQRRVKALSRGMRAKLALLLALSHGADLVILDEATSGLDPVAADEVLQTLVSHVSRDGMTVLFSSHQLADVEQIADHVVMIDSGRCVVSGALDDVRERWRRVRLVFTNDAPEVTFRSLGVERVAREGRVLTVVCSAGADRIVDEASALEPASVDVSPIPLKEIFLETVAREG